MKMSRAITSFFGLLILTISTAHAFPVVEWDTVSGSFDHSNFTIGTSSSLGYEVGFWGTVFANGSSATLTTQDMLISLYQKWVPISYGDLVNGESVATGSAFADNANYYDWYPLSLELGLSSYIGFQIGESPGIAEYGWAELLYDGTEVSLVSSATERTGLGIYAGTGTAIPEPATLGLLLFGAVGLAWRKR